MSELKVIENKNQQPDESKQPTPEEQLAIVKTLCQSMLMAIEMLTDANEVSGRHRAKLNHLARQTVTNARTLLDE